MASTIVLNKLRTSLPPVLRDALEKGLPGRITLRGGTELEFSSAEPLDTDWLTLKGKKGTTNVRIACIDSVTV